MRNLFPPPQDILQHGHSQWTFYDTEGNLSVNEWLRVFSTCSVHLWFQLWPEPVLALHRRCPCFVPSWELEPRVWSVSRYKRRGPWGSVSYHLLKFWCGCPLAFGKTSEPSVLIFLVKISRCSVRAGGLLSFAVSSSSPLFPLLFLARFAPCADFLFFSLISWNEIKAYAMTSSTLWSAPVVRNSEILIAH